MDGRGGRGFRSIGVSLEGGFDRMGTHSSKSMRDGISKMWEASEGTLGAPLGPADNEESFERRGGQAVVCLAQRGRAEVEVNLEVFSQSNG